MNADPLEPDAHRTLVAIVARRFGGIDRDGLADVHARQGRVRRYGDRAGFILEPEPASRLIDICNYADKVYR
jgi:hypothetical protein